MKFTVSKKVKGSLILKPIGRPVSAGASVYIEGASLYSDDVKRAIKSGLLLPDGPEETKKVKQNIMTKTTEAVIINKTDRVVIVGNCPIRPNGSIMKEISQLDMNSIRKSVENGLIQVITDVDEELFVNDDGIISNSSQEENEIIEENNELEDGIDILEDSNKNDTDDVIEEMSAEEELAKIIEEAEDKTNAFVWDFRAQEKKKPQIVPKSGQKIIDFDKDNKDEIDMIDALDEVNEEDNEDVDMISNKINNIKKKVSSKKESKKKDSKAVKPKIIKDADGPVVQALDSMGRPLTDDMSHMVGDFDSEEISFADKEQAQKRIEEARKRDSGINIDLD